MDKAAMAFLVAALVSILSGRKIIDLLAGLKVRQTISEDAPERHMKKQGTPTMGGLIILLGTAIGLLVIRAADPKVWAVVLLTLASAGVGFLDDYLIATKGKSLGLKARQKLFAQFIIAIAFMVWVHAYRTDMPTWISLWGDKAVDLGWLYYPLSVLMIVGMSNAVNLTDGLDGLVSGLTVPFALILGILLTVGFMIIPAENLGLAIFVWALAGGCLGFLWHNCNPAKIFMGDTGSLALGAATAGVAIAGRIEFLYLVAGAIFVVEALSVIIQVISFKTTGKRVFRMAPIHHHFELSGWPEQKIVVRFWILQCLICAAVLAWVSRMILWTF